jgi:hypothetical protein
VKLTTHLSLVPVLGVSGTISPLPNMFNGVYRDKFTSRIYKCTVFLSQLNLDLFPACSDTARGELGA